MKGVLILFGESFRMGGQGTRVRGCPESYDGQMRAAQSHVTWIDHMRQKGIKVSVRIESYTTPYDNALASMYPCVVSCFHPKVMGQFGLLQHAFRSIDCEYDFILCMRIDICLKLPFLDLVQPWTTIRFLSITWGCCDRCGNHPRVNDMMMYVPRTYFNRLDQLNLCHETWDHLIRRGFSYDDLDMMCDTYHDSDSAKDYNPYYSIVNRPECATHHTNKIFNKHAYGK